MAQASKILVKDYRKILIWPLRHVSTNQSTELTTEKTISGLHGEKAQWQEILDPLKHLPMEGDYAAEYSRDEYAEYVYFHPFIQRFLFPDPKEVSASDRSMRIYRCDAADTMSLKAVSDGKAVERELQIDRLRFYTFSGNVSLFVMEIADKGVLNTGKKQEKMSFADMQIINSAVRHCYAPYYRDKGQAGEVAAGMAFSKAGMVIADDMLTQDQATKGLAEGKLRQPEILPCLEKILPELDDGLAWRMTVDNRIPSMTFVAVDRPIDVEESDFQRLVFHESVSEKPVSPYGVQTTRDLMGASELDIHWVPDGDKNTRYCFAPTGMLMLTDTSSFALGTLAGHFRRHYFQMGLIAHMQHATLLSLSDQLSTALDNVGQKNEDLRRARKNSHDILNRVLHFSHRYWFPEISNQMQPRMMFAKWHESLGVQRLYDTVMREAKEANDFLSRTEERRVAENSDRLNKIAIIGVIFGVATGLLGSNTFGQKGDLGKLEPWLNVMPVVGWTGILVSLLIFAFAGVDRLKVGRKRAEFLLLAFLGLCFFVMAALALI